MRVQIQQIHFFNRDVPVADVVFSVRDASDNEVNVGRFQFEPGPAVATLLASAQARADVVYADAATPVSLNAAIEAREAARAEKASLDVQIAAARVELASVEAAAVEPTLLGVKEAGA